MTISGDVNQITAQFHFYSLPENPDIPSGEYQLNGSFDAVLGRLDLKPSKWVDRPDSYNMVALQGLLEPDWQSLRGAIDGGGCGPFVLARLGEGAARAKPAQTQPSAPTPPSNQAQSELDTINLQVIQLYQAGQYDQALPIAEGALRLAKVLHGSEHPTIAVEFRSLAFLLKATKRSADAVPLMRHALSIDENNSGADPVAVALDLKILAGLLVDTNRIDEAEAFLRRVLAIDEKKLSPDDATIASDRAFLEGLQQERDRQRRQHVVTDPVIVALTGQLPRVLQKAVPLTIIVSLLLLWIYLRAVKRSMRRRAGADMPQPSSAIANTTAPASPLQIVTTGKATRRGPTAAKMKTHALAGRWRTASVYTVAGFSYAVTLTALYLGATGLQFAPMRFIFLALTFAWPVVLSVGLVTAIFWRGWLAATGVYFSLLVAVTGAATGFRREWSS